MHDQVWVATDRGSEMGVAWGGECEVTGVLLRVARLLERSQHKVREDALFRLSLNLCRQSLIHLRRDWNRVRNFMCLCTASGGARVAAITARRHAFHRKVAETERVTELSGGFFKLDDALGIGCFVDAVDAGNSLRLDPVRDALVCREHE